MHPVQGLVDGTAYVRLLRYLPGGTLVGTGHLTPAVVAGLGDVSGQVSRALEGFSHPGLDRILQWDLRFGRTWSTASPATSTTPGCGHDWNPRRMRRGRGSRRWIPRCRARRLTST